MQIIMSDEWLTGIDQVQKFLDGSEGVEFKGMGVSERYEWVEKTLVKFGYLRIKKDQKGVIRQYLRKVTGYSMPQITRLVREYRKTGHVRRTHYERHRFSKRYTEKDIEFLAETDKLHGRLSGPATKKIMEREYGEYRHKAYKRISEISVSHLYNLRRNKRYLRKAGVYKKTRSKAVKIGIRTKPDPGGKPGYIRIDTVHQGDMDKTKGVYHINAVDEVTQWEIVASVEKISEQYLESILKEILAQFPFEIKGFHSDNGSEYVNKVVCKLLNKLLIRFTKSRPRHSNDNALVETKNGAIIRKHYGYTHIPREYAELMNGFNRVYLNPYLNFHRPCFYPKVVVTEKGKEKKTYPYDKMMTPFEKLKSIPNIEKYLNKEVNLAILEAQAKEESDNEFARKVVKARAQLFDSFRKRAA